jgi:hypothetical protein
VKAHFGDRSIGRLEDRAVGRVVFRDQVSARRETATARESRRAYDLPGSR